ncbi:MAG: type VII toxin-antitoxin system MntA family adenylyltransferase antitoxin [Vulcanisaeta sp.]
MIIRDRLAMARNYVDTLRFIRGRVNDADDLSRDLVLRGAVERYLHLAVESLIDVGMRLCSLLGFKKPERYRDVARILVDNNVLDQDTGRLFELWIGFRNVLVHGYVMNDVGKLFEALQEVDELERIINGIDEYVNTRSIDPSPVNNTSKLMSRIKSELERYDFVVFAYLFGSRATGNASTSSDVDVAIFTSRDINWKELVGMAMALEDSLNLSVDLVHLNKAPLLLAYEVVSKGIVVLDSDVEERVRFEVRVLKEFLDFKPRLAQYYDVRLGIGFRAHFK